MSDAPKRPAESSIPTLYELVTRWQNAGFERRRNRDTGGCAAYLRAASELGWILAHARREEAWPLEPPKPKAPPTPPPAKPAAPPNPFAVPTPGKSGGFLLSRAGDAIAPRGTVRPRRPPR